MPFEDDDDLAPQSPTPITEHESEVFRTPKSRAGTEVTDGGNGSTTSHGAASIEQLLSMEESVSDARGNDDDEDVTASSSSPIVSPPYWLQHSQQTFSTAADSGAGADGGRITMMDNEVDEDGAVRSSASWARAVEIRDYVVVNGSATNIGAFVVFNVRVQTANGSYINIRKRYSEFDVFRRCLVQSFPNFEEAVPPLPAKSVISKLRPNFLEKRRSGLQYFLNCILLNPEFSGSPVLKEFLFA